VLLKEESPGGGHFHKRPGRRRLRIEMGSESLHGHEHVDGKIMSLGSDDGDAEIQGVVHQGNIDFRIP